MPTIPDNHLFTVKRIGRRRFLQNAGAGLLALGLPRTGLAATPSSQLSGANEDVRIAVIGIGSKDAVGGVGGRGLQLIDSLQKVRGARLVALCDVDQNILTRLAAELKDQGQPVATYGDLRRVFDDKSVDAVLVATPNHWHWSWPTGSGEMGNNGVHYIDLCRWAMKLDATAPRVMSVGGRFGFDDDGETPNTQVAVLDYQPAPIYCEVRGLPENKSSTAMDSFLNTRVGVVLQCEGGYFSGAHLAGAAFDHQGKEIKKFGPIPWGDMDTGHMANFVEAVRSRKAADLHAEILEGHLSAACCHLVNISHRLGRTSAPGVVLEQTKANPVLSDAVARYREHLRANEIDFAATEHLGPALTFDSKQERFVGDFATEANALLRRVDREPFVVPTIV